MNLSAKTKPALACEVCGKPAAFDGGVLFVTYEELRRVTDEFDTWQVATNALNPVSRNGFRIISNHLPLPDPAQWRWEHMNCSEDPGSYWIDGKRIDTPAKALGWTLHFLGKRDAWLRHSNWEIMMNRLGLVTDA